MDRAMPLQTRSRDRVASIFEAARKLLREGGTERCTVAAISFEAGISAASLYRYFPDATSVIRALAESSLQELHDELTTTLAAIQTANDVPVALGNALERYISHFTSDRALRELWFGTLADPTLMALNIADSRRNGDAISRALAPHSTLSRRELRDRWFLLSHMIGAAVGLTLDVTPSEARRLRTQLVSMLGVIATAD